MLRPDTFSWRDTLIFTREIEVAGERTEFFTRVRAGDFERVRRGVYMEAGRWRSLDLTEQYRMLVLATAAYSRHPLVMSHKSAGALWRLPSLPGFGRDVHAVGDSLSGSSTSLVHRHHDYGADIRSRIEGVEVTSLARTVVDIAQTAPFVEGVVAADAALRRSTFPLPGLPVTRLDSDDLRAHLAEVALRHGSARVRRVIDFADARADRPGESISRVNMHLARLTPPELQVAMTGASGRTWTVDFWWPQFNLIGEFDGATKYSEPEFLRGRTPHETLIDEKFREDDLRATGRTMTRWMWNTAIDTHRLRSHLVGAGVR